MRHRVACLAVLTAGVLLATAGAASAGQLLTAKLGPAGVWYSSNETFDDVKPTANSLCGTVSYGRDVTTEPTGTVSVDVCGDSGALLTADGGATNVTYNSDGTFDSLDDTANLACSGQDPQRVGDEETYVEACSP